GQEAEEDDQGQGHQVAARPRTTRTTGGRHTGGPLSSPRQASAYPLGSLGGKPMSTRPVSQRPLVPLAVAATAAAGLAVPLGTAAAAPDASGLVISEAYGGGGNN